ncbi:MAG: replication-associated recombination protein A [Mycoplasmataceae bacterium]|nr:replication-associated recombination protein A [Mycoplasmataceae bacterium]
MEQTLALKIRPKKISDIIGQKHILNSDSIVQKMIKNNKLYSLIFFGPPGIGKTSLAIVLANELKKKFSVFNCSFEKKEQLVKIIDEAKKNNDGFVIIVEEIHRLNRDKQDILLSFLEEGTFCIFATTTENPYFVVNPAVRSRCQIVELKPLQSNEILIGVKNIIEKNKLSIDVNEEILKIIIGKTNGDMRSVINILDIFINLYKNVKITNEILENVLQQSYITSGGFGDEYHDLKSAFHKSIRGSDIDAAIYYLARLLAVGDIGSISRRLISLAYEDIGLANPQLCSRTITACEAAQMVGLPECKQIFATIVVELCLSPKSNSTYKAIVNAMNDVENGKVFPIPNHIRDQSYSSAKKLGRFGYKYPHDYKNAYVEQQYLPTEIINKKYYSKNDNQIETKMNEYLEKIKKK